MLERLGYEVLEARHGAEAVARLEEDGSVARGGRIALVLSDVVMPEMGAERLLERLRAEWPRLPVLLMSGYSETAARDGLPRAPGDDAPRPFDGVELLEKPIEAQVLASRLRAVLEAPR
jgi:CheY-like chemotaxis protein